MKASSQKARTQTSARKRTGNAIMLATGSRDNCASSRCSLCTHSFVGCEWRVSLRYAKANNRPASFFSRKKRKSFPCSGHLRPGTKAYISCQTGYLEPTSGVIPELTCLESGQWDLEAHKCEADCGVILKGGLLTFVNILVKFPNASSNFRRKH